MFDIGWSEMMFVAIIAILVIGPKDLPKTIAAIGKYIRKAKGFARDFQSGIDDLAKDAELDDIKKSVTGQDFNIKKQVEDAVDPTGEFSKAFEDLKPTILDEKSDVKPIKTPEKKDKIEAAEKIQVEENSISPETPSAEDTSAKPESKVST